MNSKEKIQENLQENCQKKRNIKAAEKDELKKDYHTLCS